MDLDFGPNDEEAADEAYDEADEEAADDFKVSV
jgi:hypothetical protein